MQQLVAEAEKAIAPDHSDETAALGRELTERLATLERKMEASFDRLAIPPDTSDQLERLETQMHTLCTTETVNQRLFNSLHEELKNYRDNFLRESLQKPFIRDLVMLFDDLSSLSVQMESTDVSHARISQWSVNLTNSMHALLEILHRMEVSEIEPKEMVDRSLHKVTSFEPADFAEDDGRIVMRLKRGFIWRGQVLRPEEVVAKRFA